MAVLPIGINPATGGGGAGGYQIERSLRFNSADSAYLSRTPASTGSQTSWTWSGWVKRSAITNTQDNIYAINNSNRICFSNGDSSQTLFFEVYNGGGADYYIGTSAVYRDVSAWYHIVAVWDSNNATAGDRQRLYVNGIRITAFSSGNSIPSGATSNNWNGTAAHNIGRSPVTANHFNGYLTEIYFIDGQALTPSSFGETDSATGVWKPKAYSGTYGTNGFYLKFADNSGTTSTTLGKDSSGNGNNWTPNNFSVTAGTGNDSMVDSPTLYGTDTGAGGEVRGNYCTLNPLRFGTGSSSTTTISDGNLKIACSSNAGSTIGTIAIPSTGKWYWEAVVPTQTYNFMMVGVIKNQELLANLNLSIGNLSTGYAVYAYNGQKYNNGSSSTYMAAPSQNTVVTVAFDADTGSLYVGAGGSWANGSGSTNQTWANAVAAYTGITGTIHPASSFDTGNCYVNFGQRPFAYTAPSGFKALCTTNLPTPTIGATSSTQAGKYFNPVLYTGNGSTQSITGVGFEPDFVWIKNRTSATSHQLFDSIRGATNRLFTDLTNAEETNANSLTSFNSDGFSVGSNLGVNTNTNAIVAWCWDAAGSNATNTSGTITSTVRANTTSGFSVVTWAASGVNPTIGHGLGAAPSMIIAKSRNNAGYGWAVYHKSLGRSKFLSLNATTAETSYTNYWGTSDPTSTVFGTSDGSYNNNIGNMVAYCFAPVAGYSAFGSYTGNGSTDGPFVYTGFRPRYVLIKNITTGGAGYDWFIHDTARDTYNVCTLDLEANLSLSENQYGAEQDILSNGFKLRNSGAGTNASSNTYIYAAFAESPFKYALAR